VIYPPTTGYPYEGHPEAQNASEAQSKQNATNQLAFDAGIVENTIVRIHKVLKVMANPELINAWENNASTTPMSGNLEFIRVGAAEGDPGPYVFKVIINRPHSCEYWVWNVCDDNF
jgi:hypothetical protein